MVTTPKKVPKSDQFHRTSSFPSWYIVNKLQERRLFENIHSKRSLLKLSVSHSWCKTGKHST